MIKITLDTNCIINILDFTSSSATSVEEISEIIRYALEGNVNIAITTRVSSDIERDKDDKRKKEFLSRIAMFPIIGTISRWETSKWDSGDVWADTAHKKIQEELKKIIFPNLSKEDVHYTNKINDIDHLMGHIIGKRDIFVTDDKEILKKSEELKNSPGVTVMNPKKCLEYINLRANKIVLIEEFREKFDVYKKLLEVNMGVGVASKKDGENFSELREWFLKKLPILKDGLLNFKQMMVSVPMGEGRRMMDNSQALGLEYLNEELQKLFSEQSVEGQLNELAKTGFDGYATNKNKEVSNKLNKIRDLLISYSGYLENQ